MGIIDDDRAIGLGQLISQPLVSTLEADCQTAQRFVEFITEYGLEEVDNVTLPGESTPSKLKMITFVYRQVDPVDRQEKLFQVQVPLISLIPLPLLQIERAEFDFNIRIFSEVDLTSAAGGKGGLKEQSDTETMAEEPSFQGFKARLSPAVGRSESGEISQTVDANMKIKVQMRQADLPGGLAYWMSTFTNAASVNPVDSNQLEAGEESSSSTPSGNENDLLLK